MKERPILFTPENAQKVFDGVKTQTRRIVKLPSLLWDYPQMNGHGMAVFLDSTRANPYDNALDVACPYGQPGDRLWIRECWADVNTESGPAFQYRSGFLKFCQDEVFPVEYARYPGSQFTMWCSDLMRGEPDHRWRSAMHMYRYACRTVVELTEVRVERVQEITEEDAKAEGCEPHFPSGVDGKIYRRPFNCLWESIHGTGSWEMNPWVWVLTMRKVAVK